MASTAVPSGHSRLVFAHTGTMNTSGRPSTHGESDVKCPAAAAAASATCQFEAPRISSVQHATAHTQHTAQMSTNVQMAVANLLHHPTRAVAQRATCNIAQCSRRDLNVNALVAPWMLVGWSKRHVKAFQCVTLVVSWASHRLQTVLTVHMLALKVMSAVMLVERSVMLGPSAFLGDASLRTR